MSTKCTYNTAKKSKKQVVRETAVFFPVTEFFAGSGLVTEALKDYFSVVWANDICVRKANTSNCGMGL